MIFRLFRKNPDADAVYAVYSAIVAQSRQPVFYAEWGVPDTVTGRFDMISLHLGLLFRRFKAEQGAAQDFSQAVFDLFFRDMDRSLREMGAGDLAIPKKVQKMGSLFFGLMTGINSAIDRGDHDAVRDLLTRNIYGGTAGKADALTGHLFAESARLAVVPVEDITGGRLPLKAVA